MKLPLLNKTVSHLVETNTETEGEAQHFPVLSTLQIQTRKHVIRVTIVPLSSLLNDFKPITAGFGQFSHT